MTYAAKTAEYEAKIALNKAQQVELDARAQLSKAEKMKPGVERDEAITIAQDKLKLSQEGINIAQENLSVTQQETSTLEERIANQREINKLQQKAAFTKAAAEAGVNISYEEFSKKSLANPYLPGNPNEYTPPYSNSNSYLGEENTDNNSNSVGSIYGANSRPYLQNQLQNQPDPSFLLKYISPQNNKDNEDIYQQYLRINKNDLSDTQYQLYKPQTMQNQTQTQGQNLGLGTTVNQIQTKLDNLINSIYALASRPTNLNVTSTEPIQDAAAIYSEILRSGMRGNGL